jgi:hypothetical protein
MPGLRKVADLQTVAFGACVIFRYMRKNRVGIVTHARKGGDATRWITELHPNLRYLAPQGIKKVIEMPDARIELGYRLDSLVFEELPRYPGIIFMDQDQLKIRMPNGRGDCINLITGECTDELPSDEGIGFRHWKLLIGTPETGICVLHETRPTSPSARRAKNVRKSEIQI